VSVVSDDEAAVVDDSLSEAEPAAQPAPLPARSRQVKVTRYLKEVITPTLEPRLKVPIEVNPVFFAIRERGSMQQSVRHPLGHALCARHSKKVKEHSNGLGWAVSLPEILSGAIGGHRPPFQMKEARSAPRK
jgi:hypothetical protein